MLEILGLLKRWLLNILRIKSSRISTSLLIDLISLYFSPPKTSGVLYDGKWSITYTDPKSTFYTYIEIFIREIYKTNLDLSNIKILDIGSNIGLSVLYFKEIHPNSIIKALEPDPAIFEVLAENIKVNKLKGVTVLNKACWSFDGKMKFHSSKDDSGHLGNDGDIEVECINVMSLLENPSEVIKIDIEGAENFIFQEMKDGLIKANQIFFEYHSLVRERQILGDILNHFSKNSFRYYVKDVGGKSDVFDGQYNLTFLKI